MKKTKSRRLQLSREAIRMLQASATAAAIGGLNNNGGPKTGEICIAPSTCVGHANTCEDTQFSLGC